MNDRRLALNQARIAYWSARQRIRNANTKGSSAERGAALADCRRARESLMIEAGKTAGWLAGRKYERGKRR